MKFIHSRAAAHGTSPFRLYLTLFAAFFRIGLFTFGGGYAMLPMLERETVDRYHWTDSKELLDIFALSQCTPGVIAVNTATFLGKKTGGFWGAAAATLGVITPSILIITIIAAVLQNFADYPAVIHAMAAVRVAVTALIFAAILKMARSALRSVTQIVLAVLSFLAVALFGWSPVIIVIAASVYGFFFMRLPKNTSRPPEVPAKEADEAGEDRPSGELPSSEVNHHD